MERDVAEANGISKVERRAGINRVSVYKALSEKGIYSPPLFPSSTEAKANGKKGISGSGTLTARQLG